jgi:hypothetical protein
MRKTRSPAAARFEHDPKPAEDRKSETLSPSSSDDSAVEAEISDLSHIVSGSLDGLPEKLHPRFGASRAV